MQKSEEIKTSLRKIVKKAIVFLQSPASKHAVLQNFAPLHATKRSKRVVGHEAKFWIEDKKGWNASISGTENGGFAFRIDSNATGKGKFEYSGTFTDPKGLDAHLVEAKKHVEKLYK